MDKQIEACVKTILCVEDNKDNLKVIRLMVHRLRPNDRFISTQTAEEGITIAKQLQPDLILMDIDLPGMSGMDAFLQLRNHLTSQHIPIIAISAHAMLEEVQLGLTAGFDAYITKPVDMHVLQTQLDQVLTEREMADVG